MSEKTDGTVVERPKPGAIVEEHPDVRKQQKYDVKLVIAAIRILSVVITWTFFQPDEYYQSLEPAWNLAFGEESGAWITWEWHHALRSSLHPLNLAAVYKLTAALNWIVGPPLSLRARVFIWTPRLYHAFGAGVQDYFTWQLAESLFGEQSQEAAVALAVSLLSPWHFFAGSRSLSNSMEASWTTFALAHWPWRWYGKSASSEERKRSGRDVQRSVVMAACAVVLRPTNGLIWLILTGSLVFSASQEEILLLSQQIAIYGTAVVACTNGLDRWFYGEWTFPPARFLGFNVVEGLSEFYGRNRRDYYFTEGLPLLLMTVLPFALGGFYQARSGEQQLATRQPVAESKDAKQPTTNQQEAEPKDAKQQQPQPPKPDQAHWNNADALRALATTVLVMITALSCIAHKEARFLYPLFPIFSILAARPICQFFAFTSFPQPSSTAKTAVGVAIVIVNIAIALYVCTVHQRGPIDVLQYLRSQFYAINTDALVLATRLAGPTSMFTATGTGVLWLFGDRSVTTYEPLRPISAAFLMPCHSTPWRSHLVHPEIHAWALTCEPPIGLNGTARDEYLDEADQFYADPVKWLSENMGEIPSKDREWLDQGWDMRDAPHESKKAPTSDPFASQGRRPWPRYVVFFEQLQEVMQSVAGGPKSRYQECWRGFNSHWHDDWRRQGDIVVWCIDGSIDRKGEIEEYDAQVAERAEAEQQWP